MIFCPHCGVPAEAGARFCANCGRELAADEDSPSQVGSPESAPILSPPESDAPPAHPTPEPGATGGKGSLGAVGWMRKLGILRGGVYSGTYTSGRDMPAELLMDNVYNAEKDLIHRSDFQRPAKAPAAAGPAAGARTGRIRAGRVVYFVIMTLIAGFWLIACLSNTDSIPVTLLQLALWIGLGVVAGFFTFAGRFGAWAMTGLTFFVLVFSILLLALQ